MRYSFENYCLDVDRQELRRGAELVAVEPQVFDLLHFLIRNRDRVVSKDDLIANVWNGRAISDSTLSSRITIARQAIGDDGDEQRLIRTTARKGVRFVGPVQEQLEAREALRTGDAPPPPIALPDKPSIAALPFDNLSGDPEQDYFADGMVDDIITGLSRIKWLFVIARNTSFTYKDRAVDVKQVGRELGVRYVLEGSVRKAGDQVRVSAQLIDALTGMHVWAERYDRKFDDIFALQDEMTLSVVGAIEPSLRQAEVERVRRKRSENLDAYDLVLQAQSDVYSRDPEPATRALALLERALAIDPTYALAHAFAADCHHNIFMYGGLQEGHRTASILHAEAAMAHGQDDSLALAFAGFVIGIEKHDRDAAFAAFEAALAVSPSSALTYILGSLILAFAEEAERAIEWADRGLRLSPFDPWRSTAFISCSLGHYHRGRYEESVAAARKAIQCAPGYSMAYVVLAAVLVRLGRLEEAKMAAARALELQPAFRCTRHYAAAGYAPALARSLTEALCAAGLPE
jgi:TolB-like protein